MAQYVSDYAIEPLVVSNTDDIVHPELPLLNKEKQQKTDLNKINGRFAKFTTINRRTPTPAYLSDVSNLTINDTTYSSIENDLELLEPVSFDEDNGALLANFEIHRNSQRSLTLNDLHTSDPYADSSNDYLLINDSDDSDTSEYNLRNFRLAVQLDMDMDLNLDFDAEEDLNVNLKCGKPYKNSVGSNSTEYSSTNSNAYTPPSKILSNADVSTDDLKRSFTRLKQTSELLNTEKVYICSLRILERVYLNNFMSDLPTPIYFETFRQCVMKLLKAHQSFYDSLITVYQKWYDDSVAFLHSSVHKHKSVSSSAISPSFEKYNYVSNEKSYLEIIVKLILNKAIDVDTYSTYCSLYQKILSFSSPNHIETYKRDSIIILNDYLVEHKDFYADMITDKHLDTRFISVVQMPTTRMVRYKLILLSLLKNIDLDERNKAQLSYYQHSVTKLNDKIDAINNYVGNEETKHAKLEAFKKLFNKGNKTIFPNPMFLENLEDLQLASSFGVVYLTSKSSTIHYDYLCGILFKSHLILAKPSNIYSNNLEIKFVIPLISIFSLEYSTCLSTSYSDILALTFEDGFNVYEISLIFPDEKEMLLWKANLKLSIDKLKFNNYSDSFFQYKYIYSEIQSKIMSIELNDEYEKFSVSSIIPQTIKAVRSSKNDDAITSEISYYEVDHFTSDFVAVKKMSRSDSTQSFNFDTTDSNSVCTENTTRSSTLQSFNNKCHTVNITVQERCSAQSCIAGIWSSPFEMYTMTMSISRSLSNMFHSRLSLLSLVSNTPASNKNVTNTPKGQFIPPSPSFATSGGPLKSPRLRNSISTRTFQDYCRTPSSNATEEFRKHNLKHSSSLLSLSSVSVFQSGQDSSAKSIISVSTANDLRKTPRKSPQRFRVSVCGPQSKTTDTESINSSASSNKLSNGMSRLWKSLKSNGVRRSASVKCFRHKNT